MTKILRKKWAGYTNYDLLDLKESAPAAASVADQEEEELVEEGSDSQLGIGQPIVGPGPSMNRTTHSEQDGEWSSAAQQMVESRGWHAALSPESDMSCIRVHVLDNIEDHEMDALASEIRHSFGDDKQVTWSSNERGEKVLDIKQAAFDANPGDRVMYRQSLGKQAIGTIVAEYDAEYWLMENEYGDQYPVKKEDVISPVTAALGAAAEAVIQALPGSIEELAQATGYYVTDLMEALDQLLEEGKVQFNPDTLKYESRSGGGFTGDIGWVDLSAKLAIMDPANWERLKDELLDYYTRRTPMDEIERAFLSAGVSQEELQQMMIELLLEGKIEGTPGAFEPSNDLSYYMEQLGAVKKGDIFNPQPGDKFRLDEQEIEISRIGQVSAGGQVQPNYEYYDERGGWGSIGRANWQKMRAQGRIKEAQTEPFADMALEEALADLETKWQMAPDGYPFTQMLQEVADTNQVSPTDLESLWRRKYGNSPYYAAKDGGGDVESKILEFFRTNPSPEDKEVHALADELQINPHEFESMIYKLLGQQLATTAQLVPLNTQLQPGDQVQMQDRYGADRQVEVLNWRTATNVHGEVYKVRDLESGTTTYMSSDGVEVEKPTAAGKLAYIDETSISEGDRVAHLSTGEEGQVLDVYDKTFSNGTFTVADIDFPSGQKTVRVTNLQKMAGGNDVFRRMATDMAQLGEQEGSAAEEAVRKKDDLEQALQNLADNLGIYAAKVAAGYPQWDDPPVYNVNVGDTVIYLSGGGSMEEATIVDEESDAWLMDNGQLVNKHRVRSTNVAAKTGWRGGSKTAQFMSPGQEFGWGNEIYEVRKRDEASGLWEAVNKMTGEIMYVDDQAVPQPDPWSPVSPVRGVEPDLDERDFEDWIDVEEPTFEDEFPVVDFSDAEMQDLRDAGESFVRDQDPAEFNQFSDTTSVAFDMAQGMGYTWGTPKWEAAAEYIGEGIERALKGASGR